MGYEGKFVLKWETEESRVWIETEQISCSKAFAFCNSHLSGTILARSHIETQTTCH